jgi:hypothetical protein
VSVFIASQVDRYLGRLFPKVSVTVANRPELFATQIAVMIQTNGGVEMCDKTTFIPREVCMDGNYHEQIAFEIAFEIARDIMMNKPIRKEIR